MIWESLRLNSNMHVKSRPAENILETDSDETLVRFARAGNFAAFEKLFDRHRLLVYRYAYQICPRRDDAEDIVQEVFVRAYQNLHRYRVEAKFTTWLLRIATNLGTDRARMATRRYNLEQQEAAGSLSWMTRDVEENPIENLESERRTQTIREALMQLPVHHRNCIVLRDLEEKDYPDIAAILGCSVGGAKLRVLRARRALRDKLGPMLSEDER